MRREKPGEKDGDVDPGPEDSIRTALHIVQNVKMVYVVAFLNVLHENKTLFLRREKASAVLVIRRKADQRHCELLEIKGTKDVKLNMED